MRDRGPVACPACLDALRSDRIVPRAETTKALESSAFPSRVERHLRLAVGRKPATTPLSRFSIACWSVLKNGPRPQEAGHGRGNVRGALNVGQLLAKGSNSRDCSRRGAHTPSNFHTRHLPSNYNNRDSTIGEFEGTVR